MESALQDQFAQIDQVDWWFQGRRKVVASVLRTELGAAAGRALAIFDVGCGAGEMSDMLREFGTVSAIDSSAEAVGYCRARLGDAIEVTVGTIPDDLPTVASFDVVSAFDVIEHLDDDRGALVRMGAMLRPRGMLVVSVPAFGFLWGPHDVASHHRRRYRASQLRQLLESAGFTVRRLTYFNTLLFPAVAAVRLARKVAGEGAPRSDFRPLPPMLNRALTALFASEAAILGQLRCLPVGVSLLAVCEERGEGR